MNWRWLILFGVVPALGSTVHSTEQVTNAVQPRFKYERYTAENGALYRSPAEGGDSEDNCVNALLVDSSGRVWVGTYAGLSVYDGRQWTSRTLDRCALMCLTEGPAGTVWFGGGSALTRFRDGQFEQIDPGTTARGLGILGMAADRNGWLWVVTHDSVQKHDGRTWSTVLCPFPRPLRQEVSTLYGAAIGTNGHLWIGGTAHGKVTEPFEHEGSVWVVDREHKTRDGGPPMAPLYEFDGKKWRTYGPPQGLKTDFAVPELDGHGRVVARTFREDSENYFVQVGETWKAVGAAEALVGKRWILRRRNRGFLPGYSELLFRDGDRVVEVRPPDYKTGKELNVRAEQFLLLRIAEDPKRGCVWLGTTHGLYRIWPEKEEKH